VPLDADRWDRLPDRLDLDPARESEWRQLAEALRTGIECELTDHQRRVFVAVVLNGVPAATVVSRWGGNRNAVYKTVFDARRKLRAYLAANGYLDWEEVKDR
jgi:RNA polymerase sigma-70 factor (ECF subfamily)